MKRKINTLLKIIYSFFLIFIVWFVSKTIALFDPIKPPLIRTEGCIGELFFGGLSTNFCATQILLPIVVFVVGIYFIWHQKV